ncbi:hypothetical protein CSIM01_02564 [Colletotrichum simmondsii]|uniref:Uncharacterized protein n=1 Tax=Colletotrichum simmondsii TaxID=703756 RepID=A0A135RUC1_9PEZI|nr:hypothetical protein CSIM01_02564 [Colletotrichum simmondsii]
MSADSAAAAPSVQGLGIPGGLHGRFSFLIQSQSQSECLFSVAPKRAFDCNPLYLEIESEYSITKSPGSNAGPLVAPRPGLCSPQNLRLPLFRYRMGLSSAEIAKRESLDRDSRRQGP